MAEIFDKSVDENIPIFNDVLKKFLKMQPSSLDSQCYHAEAFLKDQLTMLFSLPADVLNRLKALKKQQVSITDMEIEYHKDLHNLEIEFHRNYNNLYRKRMKIITGDLDLFGEEINDKKLPEITPEIESELKLLKKKLSDYPGISNFWLTVLKKDKFINKTIYKDDEDILKHLMDIRISFGYDPMSYQLHFMFGKNRYFTNDVLSKEYIMLCAADEKDPCIYTGPNTVSCKGCKIDWKADKDVTQEISKIKVKHKTEIKTVEKIKKNSFFNFFRTPKITEKMSENKRLDLTIDFELGFRFRDKIIPKAILIYTGEIEDDEEEAVEEDDEIEDDHLMDFITNLDEIKKKVKSENR